MGGKKGQHPGLDEAHLLQSHLVSWRERRGRLIFSFQGIFPSCPS